MQVQVETITISQVLGILQIGVAIIALSSISFYLGKHARVLEENSGDIDDLKEARTSIDKHLNRHDTQIAVLARETDTDVHSLHTGSDGD